MTGGAPAELARLASPQIAAAVAAGPAPGQIEVRLDPPELGRVEITLDVTDQNLRAVLAADRPATAEMLRRHADLLVAQLQQAGFADIDLDFADHRGGSGASPGQGQTGDHPGPRREATIARDMPEIAVTEGRVWPRRQDGRADSIDLRL